ncbi:MAG TPA: hypothetical protein PLG59_15415 [bacterium]|nr:hypothetical protein [bacterium]HQO36051.1 hypothetical protein [bacterium]HQQ01105.1 hypothetical protein [bacterium]
MDQIFPLVQAHNNPFGVDSFFVSSQVDPQIVILLVIPIVLLYAYAIYDATTTASKKNRKRVLSPGEPPSQAVHAEADAQLRSEAAAVIGEAEPSPGPGDSTQQGIPKSRAHYAWRDRFHNNPRFGWILVFIGVIFFGQAANISWLKIEYIWPVIPLAFGARLLNDYRKTQHQPQLISGLIFIGLGLYCLSAAYGIFGQIRSQFETMLPLGLVALGVIMIVGSKKHGQDRPDKQGE